MVTRGSGDPDTCNMETSEQSQKIFKKVKISLQSLFYSNVLFKPFRYCLVHCLVLTTAIPILCGVFIPIACHFQCLLDKIVFLVQHSLYREDLLWVPESLRKNSHALSIIKSIINTFSIAKMAWAFFKNPFKVSFNYLFTSSFLLFLPFCFKF